MTTIMPPPPDPSTLHHPRILCLHGGGTNARIFHMQCRALLYNLKPDFRLVFAEAPHPATAGPDVLTVYAECGPFKRWVLTTAPNAVEQRPAETWQGIEKALGDAMDADDALGATGEWVAVLGFSQGAKIAASLLLRQQEAPEKLGRLDRRTGRNLSAAPGFRFGVLMAGRGPLLAPVPEKACWLDDGERFYYEANAKAGRVLRVPTVHVHGMHDPGLGYHQILLEEWCEPSSTVLLEWEGDHRLPIKTGDVSMVCGKIREFAAKTTKKT